MSSVPLNCALRNSPINPRPLDSLPAEVLLNILNLADDNRGRQPQGQGAGMIPQLALATPVLYTIHKKTSAKLPGKHVRRRIGKDLVLGVGDQYMWKYEITKPWEFSFPGAPVLFDQVLIWRSLSEAAACLQSRRGDRNFWKRLRVILLEYNDGGADNLMIDPYRTGYLGYPLAHRVFKKLRVILEDLHTTGEHNLEWLRIEVPSWHAITNLDAARMWDLSHLWGIPYVRFAPRSESRQFDSTKGYIRPSTQGNIKQGPYYLLKKLNILFRSFSRIRQ